MCFRSLLVLLFIFFGAKNIYAQTECIVVSGFSRDSNGSFYKAKEYLDKYKHCKIVSKWSDVNPTSVPGSDVFIMQLSHGLEGGVASLDSGDTPPEKIFDKINDLSSKYKLGVYVESCFSGDLLGKFLTSPEYVQKNTCLMTASVLNRESYGGDKSNVKLLLSQEKEFTLSSFFQNHMRQGLISGASWENSGFLDLMLNASVNLNLERMINDLLAAPSDLKCKTTKTVPTGVKAICNGLSGKEVTSIASLVLSEELNAQYPPETRALFQTKKYKAGMVKVLTDMPYFKANSKIKSIVSQCMKSKTPVTCITENTLPGDCSLKNENVKKDLGKALLGVHPDIRFGVFDLGMENDPAAMLYHFSQFSLRNEISMSKNDQVRREACDSFKISWQTEKRP
ncbi:hypothetical protein DOM21_05515 [Bacteriovorax stolpii]|uniref:Uncharacterized protein n=2 Tax=Bacteriovorax stolpii TaxID=960 RepID=A0A2K9NVK7_BACTC|nr:hypothetical protein [Bacteriovorax stolpii]AUN99095.1 hypothetical protein C0V70_13490 [Bacteriovorax stolpii]QDK40923.1 hypothetical protein DOM21_05515 [Bacteriovorax stolpii]TDP55375.1 hypothetical protein C8D79_0423 [Bacteriovorax stolpii]